jgi:hypothetical protein
MLSETDIDRGSREERGAEDGYKLGAFQHGTPSRRMCNIADTWVRVRVLVLTVVLATE